MTSSSESTQGFQASQSFLEAHFHPTFIVKCIVPELKAEALFQQWHNRLAEAAS